MRKNEPNWRDKYEANIRYDVENTRRYAFKLNKNTDPDVIDALENCGNKQGFIKEAIRFYIAHSEDK